MTLSSTPDFDTEVPHLLRMHMVSGGTLDATEFSVVIFVAWLALGDRVGSRRRREGPKTYTRNVHRQQLRAANEQLTNMWVGVFILP